MPVALNFRVVLGSLVFRQFPNYYRFSLVFLVMQELERENTPPRLHRRYGMRVVWFGAGACSTVVLFNCI